MSILKHLLVAEGGSFKVTDLIDNKIIVLEDKTGVHVAHFNRALTGGLITYDEKTETISPAEGVRSFTDERGYRGWTTKDGAKPMSEVLK